MTSKLSDENDGRFSAGGLAGGGGDGSLAEAGVAGFNLPGDLGLTEDVVATATDCGGVTGSDSATGWGTVSCVWHLGHCTSVPALRVEIANFWRQWVQAKRIDIGEQSGGNRSGADYDNSRRGPFHYST
jgi:hypothetical protein